MCKSKKNLVFTIEFDDIIIPNISEIYFHFKSNKLQFKVNNSTIICESQFQFAINEYVFYGNLADDNQYFNIRGRFSREKIKSLLIRPNIANVITFYYNI